MKAVINIILALHFSYLCFSQPYENTLSFQSEQQLNHYRKDDQQDPTCNQGIVTGCNSDITTDTEYNTRLACFYFNSGQFGEAETYFQKAITSYKNLPLVNSPEYANLLANVANLYKKTGRFELAEKYYNESSQIYKTLGMEHDLNYSNNLLNQAMLYSIQRKDNAAEQLLLKAKTNLESTKLTGNKSYLLTLENLGKIYLNQSQIDNALNSYNKALEIYKNKQILDSVHYAECLNSVGTIQLLKGNYTKAESLYIEAIHFAIQPGSINIHPNLYNDLAILYLQTKQYDKAEALFLQVKLVYENHYGKLNRSYLCLLENLAELYDKMQNPAKAALYQIEASKLRKRIIYDSFKYLSSNETEEFLQGFQQGIHNFNNFLFQSKDVNDTLLQEAFENELFYKGFQLNYHLELNKIILENPSLKPLSDSLKEIRRLISMENIKYPIAIPLIDSLERIALWLEKQLGQKAIHFNELMKIPHYAECKNILRKHEAIIEMMYLDLGSKLKQNRIAYAAMIATAENPSPLFIRLCTEEELQTLFVSTSRLNVDYVNTLYSMNSRGMKSLDQNSNGLYELIWKKIESQLSDVHTIYYTPAGLLNKINIQAIPLSENTVVGELYNIIQFTSSKQLLNFNEQNNSLQSALIMGGIQYDKNEVNTNDQEQHKTHARGIVHPNNRSTDNFWPLLQNTLREIHQVNEIFQENNIKTSQYTGLNASEESFKREIKNGNSPGIIHIATHGYYFNKLDKDLKSLDFSTSCSFITSVNPMMRSGLVLANGNYGWKNSKPLPGHEEDGILTALEISQMNLSHTQLAVLSACETGLGEIRGNEGVFGLQRAFKIAGVKYLIMSLWEVPDYQTEELMSHFYYNLLNQKMELPVAFQNAQLELKHKYNNPYFWAGFIMVQ